MGAYPTKCSRCGQAYMLFSFNAEAMARSHACPDGLRHPVYQWGRGLIAGDHEWTMTLFTPPAFTFPC